MLCVCCWTPRWPLILCCSSRKRRIILFLPSNIIGFFVAVETGALASLLFERMIPSSSIEVVNRINLLLFWTGLLCISWFTSSSNDCCRDKRKRKFYASMICWSCDFVMFRRFFIFDDDGSEFQPLAKAVGINEVLVNWLSSRYLRLLLCTVQEEIFMLFVSCTVFVRKQKKLWSL